MSGTILLLLALATAAGASTPVDRVILVSVDGLSAELLGDLLANDIGGTYANFRRLRDEGASTLNARTDFTHTVTLPNHTCMISGRPVAQPDGQPNTTHHGYDSNTDPLPGDTLHNQGNPALTYVPSVFDVAHDHGLTTALFASKSKFVIFDQSYDGVAGAPDPVGPDDGRDKIDVYHYEASTGTPANAAGLHAAFLAQLAAAPPRFSFVHYRDPDSAGHFAGWGSATWDAAVAAVDGYLGELLAYVAAHAAQLGSTVVIVTADHGGLGNDHSLPTDAVTYTVPFFVWGTGVPAGADLYAMNRATRADPGSGRPDYNAAAPPIRNGEAGNLALALLGLPAIPGSTIGGALDLTVTGTPSGLPVPVAFATLSAYPNPFNPQATIGLTLAEDAKVDVGVYDVAGRLVRRLFDGALPAGRRDLAWDGRGDDGRQQASGAYLVRVRGAGAVAPLTLTLVK